ncbi:MAG: BrnT family toxin [Ramlibacter sp.]
MQLEWDENKRRSNLLKHGLDFADAVWVLESELRIDVETVRAAEHRTQSLAYVFDCLAVLTVVHVPGASTRVISFRKASTEERRQYHDWLAQRDDA